MDYSDYSVFDLYLFNQPPTTPNHFYFADKCITSILIAAYKYIDTQTVNAYAIYNYTHTCMCVCVCAFARNTFNLSNQRKVYPSTALCMCYK